MATRYAETSADRAAWARLWDLTTGPWERLADLAEFLGVGRTTVQEWGPEGANAGNGAWPLLRLALRRTARRYPAAVPALVEALAGELLDVRGRWVPEADDVGDYRDEAEDARLAESDLVRAVRGGDPAVVAEACRAYLREAEEACAAAVAMVGGGR